MTSQGPLEKVEKQIESINCRMRKKVPWVGAGVIVTCLTVVALLSYEAYSGEQRRQCEETRSNTKAINALNADSKVIQSKLETIKEQIQDAKDIQKISFDTIMGELRSLRQRSETLDLERIRGDTKNRGGKEE